MLTLEKMLSCTLVRFDEMSDAMERPGLALCVCNTTGCICNTHSFHSTSFLISSRSISRFDGSWPKVARASPYR